MQQILSILSGVFLLFNCLSFTTQAQTVVEEVSMQDQNLSVFERLLESKQGEGTIVVYQDHRLEALMARKVLINEQQQTIPGFRIQLFSGIGQKAPEEANKIKALTLEVFPEAQVYLIYKAPSMRVRVGDFRYKRDCLNLYHQIQKRFPQWNAYIVADEIQLPPLKNTNEIK